MIELISKLLVLNSHVAYELPELGQPPDLVKKRIAREQGIGTQALLRRFPEPFHGSVTVPIDGVDTSYLTSEVVIIGSTASRHRKRTDRLGQQLFRALPLSFQAKKMRHR
jgi:hypothetical protein